MKYELLLMKKDQDQQKVYHQSIISFINMKNRHYGTYSKEKHILICILNNF